MGLTKKNIKEMLIMKGSKVLIIAVGAFVAVAGVVVAVYVFRNEIAYFYADIKAKIEDKLGKRKADLADFVE